MASRCSQTNRKGPAGMKPRMESEPDISKRATTREWLPAAIVFFVSFSVYVRCLHPGAAAADSSELVAAAYTGGAAHPPGAARRSERLCLHFKLF